MMDPSLGCFTASVLADCSSAGPHPGRDREAFLLRPRWNQTSSSSDLVFKLFHPRDL